MTIVVGDIIVKFDEQDLVSVGTPLAVANNAYSATTDGVTNWTNSKDVERAGAVLLLQFTTTPATVGSVALYARLKSVNAAGNEPVPSSDFNPHLCGVFQIDYGVAADTDMYTAIADFALPQINPAQEIEWYINNNATGQIITGGWKLWITPKSIGQKA